MSEQGQIDANPGGRRIDTLRTAALRLNQRQGERAAAALRELTEPLPLRLNDRQRAAIERLSNQLIEDIEDELRGAILADEARARNEGLEASLGAAHVAIAAPILERAGLLPDIRLVAVALERSDMHEAGRRLRDAGSAGERLRGLGDGSSEVADSAAMAVLIAESRANLRFEDPRLPLSDVPGILRESLIWEVAAALRHYGVTHHGVATADMDRSVSAAADRLCRDLPEETGLSDAAAALAVSIDALDVGLLQEALADGRVALYCAMLATRSDLEIADTWTLVGDPDGIGHALLLRAAGFDRESGAQLVMELLGALGGELGEAEGQTEWLEVWDSFDATAASDALDPWRRTAAYRDALAAIGRSGGGRHS